MEHYYPYDLFSTTRIEETLTVEDGLIQLRHTPKYRSLSIEGFNETDSVSLQKNQFRVDYSLDTYYRESTRLVHFNSEVNGRELTISYITCGTVITADDMNEIKAHLESDHSGNYTLPIASMNQRGGIRVGENLYMTGDILNASVSSGLASLPTASATQLGGIKVGNGLSMSGDTLNATPYVLPTASTETKGGVIIGKGLYMTDDTLNASVSSSVYTVESQTFTRVIERDNRTTELATIDEPVAMTDWQYTTFHYNGDDSFYFVLRLPEGLHNVSFDIAPLFSPSEEDPPEYFFAESANTVTVTYEIHSENFQPRVKIGKGLTMDGDTLNASGGEGIGYFKNFTGNSFTAEDSKGIIYELRWQEESFDLGVDTYFEEQFGRAPVVGDIALLYAPGNETIYILRTGDKWVNLGTWGWQNINPLLSVADREKLDNLPNGLVLGEGLAFDEDGKLCVVKEKNPDGWAYQDSGYDVIPAAPLIYVDETHFYQPEWNARMNDMFNTPEGVMEFWIRCDLTCAGLVYPDRFGFGYYSKTSGTFVGMMNGNYDNNGVYFIGYNMACFLAGENGVTSSQNRSNLYFSKNGEHHILFHAVSHPTEGYKEVTINYGTYRVSGNVNDGNPFDSFFVYSNSEHALFSNFVVSSTQLEY